MTREHELTGHAMPKTPSFLPHVRVTLALVMMSTMTLGGCSLMQKTADASLQSTSPEGNKGMLAKVPALTSNKRVGTVAAKPSQLRPGIKIAASTEPTAEYSFPPAPAAPQSSIAGLTTQPTGVRAGAGSIFSSAPPAAVAANSAATGLVPADLPRRGFNAMTASVYSSPQSTPAASCGADATGNPISC